MVGKGQLNGDGWGEEFQYSNSAGKRKGKN